MNKSKIYTAAMALALSLGLTLSACDDDKDVYTVNYPSASQLTGQGNNIVCTPANVGDLAVVLTYTTDGQLLVNGDPEISHFLGDGIYVLEASSDSDFSKVYTMDVDGKGSINLTGIDLSVMALNLGLKAGENSQIYLRISHKYNTNSEIEGTYSNIVSVNVNPLVIDMHYLKVTLVDAGNAEDSLYSAEEDNVYKGFLPFTSGWAHWRGLDGQYRFIGNDRDWNFSVGQYYSQAQFNQITEGGDNINFWAFGTTGCALVTVDAKNADDIQVKYEQIKSLKVSGDVEGDFSFSADNTQFVAMVEAVSDNAKIKVTGVTEIYNKDTGSDSGKEGGISFAPKADGTLELNGNGEFLLAKAGTNKIILDLNNPAKLTYKIVAMGNVVVYPSLVKAVSGDASVDLVAELEDGVATGKYSGKIETGADAISFVDGSNNALTVECVDSESNPITLESEAIYKIQLDLTTNKAVLTKVLYEAADYINLYADNAYATLLSRINAFSKTEDLTSATYVGLYYQPADVWNFYIKDKNDFLFGVQDWNENNNNQFTFIKDRGDKFWYDPATPVIVTFDVASAQWETVALESVNIVGVNDDWTATSNPLTNNGDGTFSATLKLNDYPWGFQILLNGSWDYKFRIDDDGYLQQTDNTNIHLGKYTEKDTYGTYKVTLDCKANKITFVEVE